MSNKKVIINDSEGWGFLAQIALGSVLMFSSICGYLWLKFDSNGHFLPAHISEVATLSKNFKEDYGCYPTSPKAFTDLSIYKNPDFNSCNETIDVENAYAPSFTKNHNVKIADNQFILTHSSYEARGDIKIVDNKIVYRLKLSDNERKQQVYDSCVIQHKQSRNKLNVKNYKTVSDKNPCGKDVDGNLLLQIGTLSLDELPINPDVIPRQIANHPNLSML